MAATVCTYICIYLHADRHTHMYICIYIYMHTHTHIHTHTHTHIYGVHSISFQIFFVLEFKNCRRLPWTFGMLLLYILWDDWPICMISGWLAKGFGLGLLCWGFKGVQEEIPSEEASTLQIEVSDISTRIMHQSTTPSVSQTIWPRLASRQFLTLPIVQTLLPVTFGYSLSLEAVVMRQLRIWKRLWRRSLTRSHKRTSMGPSRSCWKSTASALQPEEITSKGTRV